MNRNLRSRWLRFDRDILKKGPPDYIPAALKTWTDDEDFTMTLIMMPFCFCDICAVCT